MPHNVSLPQHVYVKVRGPAVGQDDLVPGIWLGISSVPERAFGCHVLLESGALVSELPLAALVAYHLTEEPEEFTPGQVQAWDCFGWDAEVAQFTYLRERRARLLGPDRTLSAVVARYLFTIDWVNNGFSNEPEQHKLLHVLQTDDVGLLVAMPNDRLLWIDDSFTVPAGVPKVRRQVERHYCEV